MSSVSFTMENNTCYVVKGSFKKEVSKELFLEMLQLTLAHLSPSRDYSSVSSINKLLKIVELECEPDESDGEGEEEPEPEPVQVPEKKSQPVKQTQKQQPVKQTPKKPVKNESSDEDSDDD
jgi:outer membrane biosynthesis protein TonB